MSSKQRAIIQQQIGEFRGRVMAGLKIDRQQPIGRTGNADDLVGRARNGGDVGVNEGGRCSLPAAADDPVLRRELGEVLERIVDSSRHGHFFPRGPDKGDVARAAIVSCVPNVHSRACDPVQVRPTPRKMVADRSRSAVPAFRPL
jgi:hypothetical protein